MGYAEAVRILERRGRVSLTSDPKWKARAQCVSHEDNSPSLSVGEDRDGRLMLNCFGPCTFKQVLSALEDLAAGRAVPKAPGSPTTPVKRKVVDESLYMVCDLDGKHVADHVKMRFADGSKWVPWKLPSGEYKDGLRGRVLETLPLFGSEYIRMFDVNELLYVTEGEGDCVAAWKQERQAVATVTGAGSIPSDEVLRCLLPWAKAGTLRLWTDADKEGEQHMLRIRARLQVLMEKENGNGNPDRA